MTLLLTPCPHCGENFMMLDTEDETGECILCKKRSRFTREEIDAAESRRDGLSERYLGPIQQAFNDNDFETVTSLCEEVGREGVSSWYIWTVAGVCDARQGKGDQAMDAFGLATEFLDEESFDEFYDMVMDAVLDTFVADCNEERDFSIPLSDLMNLSSTIEERFYEIMDVGFPQDLFIRIGMLVDEIRDPKAFARLLTLMIYYMFGFVTENVYIPDHLEAFESMSSSVESVGNYAKEMEGQAWKDIAARSAVLMECISMLHARESAIMNEVGEKGAENISMYWCGNDTDDLVDAAGDALVCCLRYSESGGRNKGMGKKMGAAVERYGDVLARGMDAEPMDSDDVYDSDFEDHDDESGELFERMTDVELPSDIGSLRNMGEKALAENDHPLINDIAAAMVELDDMDWFGWTLAGVADSSRNEMTSAAWAFENAFYSVGAGDEERFRDIVADSFSRAISGSQDMKTALEIHSIMGVVNLLDGKIVDGTGVGTRILDALRDDAPLDSSDNRFVVYVAANGVLSAMMHTHPFVNGYIGGSTRTLETLRRVKESMDPSDEEDAELMPSVETMIDCTAHLTNALMDVVSSNSDTKLAEIASKWKGKEAYHDLVDDMRNGFVTPERFTPNGKAAVANRRLVDEFIRKYLSGPQ